MLHSTFLSSGTGFVNDRSYGLREFVKRRLSFRGLKWDSLVKLPSHGTVQGTRSRTSRGGHTVSKPNTDDMVVCGWACAHVLRFGVAPVGKAVAQELSDDRVA